jgi:sugar O-acyltransferase (sialic acid O-acetyltransferase NeuD family)
MLTKSASKDGRTFPVLKFHYSAGRSVVMRLIIIGAGGHGRVVADAARAAGITPCAFVDHEPPAAELGGLPVYTALDYALAGVFRDGAAPAFISAIGKNKNRAGEYVQALEAGLEPATVIHPSAIISRSASIGAGTFIGAQAVVNPGAVIGEDAIINTAAIIEHDCVVGAHAFVAPGAVLCGAASIGDYSFVGAGAVMIPLVSVGDCALIAAGAVVTHNHLDGVRLFGVPAREQSARP